MEDTNGIPDGLRKKFTGTEIDKGMYEGQLCMYAWTAIPTCSGRGCPAYIECTCSDKDVADERRMMVLEGNDVEVPKCGILVDYMESISNIIFRNYGESLTEPQLYRIGMHLFPLYKILGKLKIAELADGPVMTLDKGGIRRMSPIFKEIREQIKLIESTWSSIGLQLLDPEEINAGLIPPNQYEALHSVVQAKEVEERKTTRKRIKKRNRVPFVPDSTAGGE
jgi:hypothetical protein